MPIKFAVALMVLLTAVTPVSAHDFMVGSIEINHPWSRPTPLSAPVASGYVKLTNTGKEADRLVQVTSPISERAEIHRSIVEDGVASMRPANDLSIEPGATVDFQADKLHIMFIKLGRQLKDGGKFPATLVFEKAGPVDVEFVIQKKAGEAPTEDHSGHGG